MAEATRNAIVTGAASGLGRAIALRLARDGWNLLLADIDEAGNADTAEKVCSAGGQAAAARLDATQPDQWQSLHERLRRAWTRLDLLVNNVGVAGQGDVGEFPLEDWRWLLEHTLLSTIYGCHTFAPWLKQSPGASNLMNVASIAAFTSVPSMAAYNVAKAGVVALSETLYAELRPHGVGVTVVCPAFFETQLLASGRFHDAAHRRLADQYAETARLTADGVADVAVRAIGKKKFYVVLGTRARRYWRIKRWMPSLFLNAVANGYHRKIAELSKEAE